MGEQSYRPETCLEWPLSPITPAGAKRLHDALRACAGNPQGLRGGAYPSVMPVLEAAGLVTRRAEGRRATYWFLKPAGREALVGTGK
jgi:hypothetical protein